MARTNDALVRGVVKITTGLDTAPFIDAATDLVTQCCTGLDTEYTAAYLIKIETWLAAHFCRQREKQIEMEKAETVSRKFATKVDMGFNNSYQGQMAMRLDYQGGLASLDKEIAAGVNKVANITWLGTPDPTDIEGAT